MTERERFIAVCRGEKPDYYPIFGFNEAPGVSAGVMRQTYDRLMATGMPDIGGVWEADGRPYNLEGWREYWGVTGSCDIEELAAEPAASLKYETEIKDGYEYVRCETGALTRQIIDNSISYSMPDFIRFHVRDRSSWEFFRQRRTPGKPWDKLKLRELAAKYQKTDRPLRISINSTFGSLRDIVGPEMACTIFYDDPQLAHDIMDWLAWLNREYIFPVIDELEPDIVLISEDICYNHGLMISPALFREFCLPLYKEAAAVVRNKETAVFVVDTDGFAEPFVPLAREGGINALFPWEVKAGNNLLRVRREYPKFIIMGGLEKECLNQGNADLIPGEISKVQALLPLGRYFPNGDHGIQPLATFENMCRFMTGLHEICGSRIGKFPRADRKD